MVTGNRGRAQSEEEVDEHKAKSLRIRRLFWPEAPTMDASLQLLAFVFLNQALTTAIWWVCGHHWACRAKLRAIGWSLAGQRDQPDADRRQRRLAKTPQMLTAAAIAVLGCISIRRGMQGSAHRAHPDLLGACRASSIWLGMHSSELAGSGMLAGVVASPSLGIGLRPETFNPIAAEFSRIGARPQCVIMASSASVFGGVTLCRFARTFAGPLVPISARKPANLPGVFLRFSGHSQQRLLMYFVGHATLVHKARVPVAPRRADWPAQPPAPSNDAGTRSPTPSTLWSDLHRPDGRHRSFQTDQ